MVMSRRSRTSSGPPSVLAVSTTRAAGSGTNSPSVVTGARLVGHPRQHVDGEVRRPRRLHRHLARLAQRHEGQVGRRPAGRRQRDRAAPRWGCAGRPGHHRRPARRPSLAVSCSSTAVAPAAGTPVSPASGRSTAPVPMRGVEHPAGLDGGEATVGGAGLARAGTSRRSTRPRRRRPWTTAPTTPAGPTGTITKPEPLSPGPARSTVAAADARTAIGRHRDLTGAGGAGDGDAEGDGADAGRRHVTLAEDGHGQLGTGDDVLDGERWWPAPPRPCWRRRARPGRARACSGWAASSGWWRPAAGSSMGAASSWCAGRRRRRRRSRRPAADDEVGRHRPTPAGPARAGPRSRRPRGPAGPAAPSHGGGSR